jgi:hypothetical protein
MKRKMGEFDRQPVLIFEFFDTPGDEIAPRSNEIGENFEHEWLRHSYLLTDFSAGMVRFYVCW